MSMQGNIISLMKIKTDDELLKRRIKKSMEELDVIFLILKNNYKIKEQEEILSKHYEALKKIDIDKKISHINKLFKCI